VDDLCQDVAVECLRYDRKNGGLPGLGYVVQVGLNKYYSWLRRPRPQRLLDNFDEPSGGSDPATELEREERDELLRSALEALPRNAQELIRLQLEGCSLSEIVERAGRHPGTVRTRLHRARALLKAKLQRHSLT